MGRLIKVSLLVLVSLFPFPAYTAESVLSEESDVASVGRLLGIVTNVDGVPIKEVLISATGPTGAMLTVCDADGQFEFRDLAPGIYLLRTHIAGFGAPERHLVRVDSGASTVYSIALHRAESQSSLPMLLEAGFGVGSEVLSKPFELKLGSTAQSQTDPMTSDAREVKRYSVDPHDDSERAWWLRRARRSVLKDSGPSRLETETFDSPSVSMHGVNQFWEANGELIRKVPSSFPLSGQLNLLTRASVHSSSELWTSDILPGQIAYVSLGGLDQRGPWGLQGAVRTGDAGAFVLAGSYEVNISDMQSLVVGMSYSRQHLSVGTNVLDDIAATQSTDSSSREVASVTAEGAWVIGQKLDFNYGIDIARYGYLDESQLFSPHAVVTLKPAPRTQVRLAASQYMLAPGAEEFLPPSKGAWLPPERTFASLSSQAPLKAERTRHLEVVLERDFGQNVTVGVRRFTQDVSNQMFTMFDAESNLPIPSGNHYYLARMADVTAQGWGVEISHLMVNRVRSTVDYTLIDAEWTPLLAGDLTLQSIGAARSGSERFHDITASLETEIPETQTRMLLIYKFNTAFSRANMTEKPTTFSGLGNRFALQVSQRLPFAPIEGSEWELLLDVRSLFREQIAGSSVYDELLVLNPPKQILGGLVVRF